MKKLNEDLKYLIWIWLLLILAILLTWAHHGHLILDCGREVYYPVQILAGKILYKDIFNIYGPFSYMFNAFLFKLFGINLNVLYIAGGICAFLASSLIYLISSRFLTKFLSFSIAIYTISIGVLTLNLFNFVFPYAFAMLYGMVAFLASVLFLLKYQAKPDRTSFLYLSCLFAGLCVVSKYEFLLYFIVILYSIIKIKRLSFKQYYYTILSLVAVPFFCFGVLFLQGLRMEDIVSNLTILNEMAHSQTLKYFYDTQGVYFHPKTILFLILNFFKTIIPIGLLLWGFQVKNRIFSVGLILISVGLITVLTTPVTFAFFPIAIFILAILDFKNLRHNPALLILTISTILVSLKVFWGLATLNYGMFFASLSLITIIALFADKFKDKKINYNAIGVYIILIAAVLGYQNLSGLKDKNYKLETQKGEIYTTKYLYSATNELMNYIKTKTKKDDSVVILPEGLFINFLTDRKSDDFYNSLIPLYVEVFGEDKLIKHFAKTKPNYIIFNNWDTKDYSLQYICSDYAVSFCNFVAQNYTQEKVIDKDFRYLIFKIK